MQFHLSILSLGQGQDLDLKEIKKDILTIVSKNTEILVTNNVKNAVLNQCKNIVHIINIPNMQHNKMFLKCLTLSKIFRETYVGCRKNSLTSYTITSILQIFRPLEDVEQT